MSATFRWALVVICWCYYALLWPINAILVLSTWLFMAAILAAWSAWVSKSPVLGMPWRLFSTLNNTLDGWVIVHHDGVDPGYTGWRLWWQRTAWTCRNPCNGWQSELLGLSTVTPEIDFKREIQLPFGLYLKLWLGWNTGFRGGNYHPYMFQLGLKRRESRRHRCS